MKRIYFDSNVFRNLKLRPDRSEKILDSINNLIFYYSYAHLADLTRDTTEKKYDDLDFMENLVDQNYLDLRLDKKHVNIELISPTEAFKRINNFSFSNLNFTDLIDNIYPHDGNEEISKAKEILKMLLTFPMSGLSDFGKDVINDSESPAHKFAPTNTNTLLEYIEKLLNSFDDLNSDAKHWRELRTHSIESLNFKNFDINILDINFNEKLENTALQKSFLEFVEETLKNFKNTENREQFNFFITAYTCLNLLGIDKEKNSKVVFSSFQNDAQHAYYAAHCDYLVSDDEQLLLKAKALYNLFGIETQVLSIDDFYNNIDDIAKSEELDLEEFMLEMNKISENIDYEKTEVFEKRNIYTLKQPYFNYFNMMQIISEDTDSPVFAFYNHIENYSMFTSYEEIALITNKILRTMGRDLYNLKKYTINDTNEIKSDNWQGRIWDFEFSYFYLEMNNRRLTFHFQPKLG